MTLLAIAILTLGVGFIVGGLSLAVTSFLDWRTQQLLKTEDQPWTGDR